tara:strand:+ start:3355 stop:3783 length:429 start_codon:yes stop_codon:yes gene_type:complete
MAKNPKLHVAYGSFNALTDGKTSNSYLELTNSPVIPKGAVITSFVTYTSELWTLASGVSLVQFLYGPKGDSSGGAQLKASDLYSTSVYTSGSILVTNCISVNNLGQSVAHKLSEPCIIKLFMTGSAVINVGKVDCFVSYYLG